MPKNSKTLQNKQRSTRTTKHMSWRLPVPPILRRIFLIALVLLFGAAVYDAIYIQHLTQVNASTSPVHISVYPNTIVIGNGTTVSWTATSSRVCHIYGTVRPLVVGAKGSLSIPSLSSSHTYTVSCLVGTKYLSAAAAVKVLPKMAAPTGYGTLVFDDTFKGATLNASKWITEMYTTGQGGLWDDQGGLQSPYSAVGNHGHLNAEYGNPDQVVVNNGVILNATRDSSFPGYTWKAGYLMTNNKFSFDHGFAQFRARMPDSRSGAWAAFWFLEGGGEIDLQESGFTHCGTAAVNMCFANNLNTTGNSQIFHNVGTDMSTGYHTYGMRYVPGKLIAMYFDGKLMTSYTKNVPTGKMVIVMTETMASSQTTGWHTVTNSSTPSPVNSPFRILEAQVWQ